MRSLRRGATLTVVLLLVVASLAGTVAAAPRFGGNIVVRGTVDGDLTGEDDLTPAIRPV